MISDTNLNEIGGQARQETPPAQAERVVVIEWPTDKIDPSPYQARKRFDQRGIDEMAKSVKEHGIIQPLVARVVDEASGRVELVAGERRWRSATLAGLGTVPLILRKLSDTAAEEMMLIENLQREDLTVSEEARAYERMLALKDAAGAALYTLESLAAKLCKHPEHVTARLKLLLCPADMIEAVDRGDVSVSTAKLVGRIPDAKARTLCSRQVMMPDFQQVPLNFEQTQDHIRAHFMVRILKRDFDPADTLLVPVKLNEAGQRCQGGACTDCPFRSGNLEGVVLSEGRGRGQGVSMGSDPNLCTLPRCHRLKLDAAWRETKARHEQAGRKTLEDAAALRAFGGLNGALADDSGYVLLEEVSETLKGLGASRLVMPQEMVVARKPDSGEVVHLLRNEDAARFIAAARGGVGDDEAEEAPEEELDEAEEAEARSDDGIPPNVDEEATADAQAEDLAGDESGRAPEPADDTRSLQRAEQRKLARLDEILAVEAVNDLTALVHRKGVEAETWPYVFEMAVALGGVDAMAWLCDWMGLEQSETNLAKLVAHVKERTETPQAWHAMILVALLARGLQWHGAQVPELEQLLARYGVKMHTLKRRAQALLEGELKQAAPAGNAPAAGPAKNSTDPTDVSAAKEADISAAADAIAKSEPVAGPSASEAANGVQDSKLLKPERWTDADIAPVAACLKAGTTTMLTLIGPRPRPADKQPYNAWSKVRMRLLRAVKKLGADQPGHAPSRDFKGDLCTRCGVMIEDVQEQEDHINGPDCGV